MLSYVTEIKQNPKVFQKCAVIQNTGSECESIQDRITDYGFIIITS